MEGIAITAIICLTIIFIYWMGKDDHGGDDLDD